MLRTLHNVSLYIHTKYSHFVIPYIQNNRRDMTVNIYIRFGQRKNSYGSDVSFLPAGLNFSN